MITKEDVLKMSADDLAIFVDEVDNGNYNGKSLDDYNIPDYRQIMEVYHYAIEVAMEKGMYI